MTPNIHIVRHKKSSAMFCNALARSSGGKIVDEYTPGPWAGLGSPALMPDLRENMKAGHDFWFADGAYFGRGKYFRVTKNAMQHTGQGTPDFERLKPFWEKPKPWKKDGKNIVICAQTQPHYDRNGVTNWIEDMKSLIKRYSDRPIVVRHKTAKTALASDLQDAYALVCFTSNTAVDAVMEGIPTFTTGQCAASLMSLADPAMIEYPYYPDDDQRMDWAGVLAANQWTFEEMEKPQFWEQIK